MSAADWVILAVIAISIVHAASQGFFLEAFSLAGVVVGYLLAAWEYVAVSNWFSRFMNPRWVADIAGFMVIFVAVVLVAGIIGRIVSWGVRQAGLRWADRLLGAAFGLVRGFLAVTVCVLAVAAFSPASAWLSRSSIAPYLLVVGRAGTWLAPSDVRNRVRQGVEILESPKRKSEFMSVKPPRFLAESPAD